MCLMFVLWGQIYWKSWFWKIWVKFKCFWKTFRLILMHFFIKQCALRCFCINNLFFKNLILPDLRLIELVFRSIEITIKIFGLSLPDSNDVRLILDRLQLKNFQFRIHMHCIVFVSILQFCNYISHCFHT